jgi:site-specific recombinase XerD
MAWLTRYLADARPRLLGRSTEEAFWITNSGRSFGEALFALHLRHLGLAIGLRVTCHTIRRSLATHLLAAGAGPSEVAAILGHADLRSLSRYAAAAGRELKQTHARTHPRELDHE